jgi:hypothetical protein
VHTYDDAFGAEAGPEAVESLRSELQAINEVFEDELTRLEVELHLEREQVKKIAVFLLGRHLDISRDPDTLVLVVRGTVTPYDSALQVLLAGSDPAKAHDFQALVQLMNEVETREED